MTCALLSVFLAAAAVSDTEIWNEGVEYYRNGDVTNTLRVLRPLMLSKSHGARAAEVVAKIEHERGNAEEAAVAAQIALRSSPKEPRLNRNFTRAADRVPELREKKRVEAIMKRFGGQDPSSILKSSTEEARRLMVESGTYRTNRAERAVALSDSLSRRASALADTWLPVREAIAQSVTNEEQAATIVHQLDAAEKKTRKAARELGDFNGEAYATLSDVEHDYTRFMKMTAMPPVAVDEDLVAQSNAWLDIEAFNARPWQNEALEWTRAFRAKFPAWARAYEQQAQSDTNKPPFTAEDQAKISAFATELEKLQMECVEKSLPPQQEKAIELICNIRDLLPKDKNGGGQSGQPPPQNQQQNQQDSQQKKDQQDQQNQDQQNQDQQGQDQQDEKQDEKQNEEQEQQSQEDEQSDKELEALLKKAQERNDEHEAEKKARMRKSPLPPNERDW